MGIISWIRGGRSLRGTSDFRRAADRIAEIYGSGVREDGIHTLQQTVKITEHDYLLMGCANSCARCNFPDLDRSDREEGRWFAGGDDLESNNRFGNYHATKRGDRWIVDSFYTSLPRPQFRATPEEVAWHYLRVKELRALNTPQPERVTIMDAERATKPWEQMA